MNAAHELLLAHLQKMQARVDALHERARAAERRASWLKDSRDSWRTKALAASTDAQVLRVKVRGLELSRDLWKSKAIHRARRVHEERTKYELWKHRALVGATSTTTARR